MFDVFTLAMKFDCLLLGIFQSFHSLIFKKLSPRMYVSKDALNHFLVHSSAKNSLRRAKNVAFLLFCIWVDRPMGRIQPPPPAPPGYATADI